MHNMRCNRGPAGFDRFHAELRSCDVSIPVLVRHSSGRANRGSACRGEAYNAGRKPVDGPCDRMRWNPMRRCWSFRSLRFCRQTASGIGRRSGRIDDRSDERRTAQSRGQIRLLRHFARRSTIASQVESGQSSARRRRRNRGVSPKQGAGWTKCMTHPSARALRIGRGPAHNAEGEQLHAN